MENPIKIDDLGVPLFLVQHPHWKVAVLLGRPYLQSKIRLERACLDTWKTNRGHPMETGPNKFGNSSTNTVATSRQVRVNIKEARVFHDAKTPFPNSL